MNALMLLLDVWVPAILAGADKVPAPNDVKAGWLAFAVFIGLGLAVAFLGFSLSRHLRKASHNAEQGAFDPSDEPRRSAS
jgi:hypothetical protein